MCQGAIFINVSLKNNCTFQEYSKWNDLNEILGDMMSILCVSQSHTKNVYVEFITKWIIKDKCYCLVLQPILLHCFTTDG